MKRHQRLLKAYQVAMRLYPNNFYKAYGDQILLIANDKLQEAPTRRAVAKAMGGLLVDLVVTTVKENGKNIADKIVYQAKNMRRKPKRLLALWGLQLIGVGAVTYFWLTYAMFNINALRRVKSESFFSDYFWAWLAQVVTVLIPLLLIPLAFMILRKAAPVSLWRRLAWSYGLGLVGIVCYLLIARIANGLSIHYTSQHHDYDWLLGLLFVTGYYFILRQFQARRRMAKND